MQKNNIRLLIATLLCCIITVQTTNAKAEDLLAAYEQFKSKWGSGTFLIKCDVYAYYKIEKTIFGKLSVYQSNKGNWQIIENAQIKDTEITIPIGNKKLDISTIHSVGARSREKFIRELANKHHNELLKYARRADFFEWGKLWDLTKVFDKYVDVSTEVKSNYSIDLSYGSLSVQFKPNPTKISYYLNLKSPIYKEFITDDSYYLDGSHISSCVHVK